MTKKKVDPIRPTDDKARTLARDLIASNNVAALGTLVPDTGHPQVTRVTYATDGDCTPVLLISDLANHTVALRNDPRCSLLIGEPGKGDPLAHPRITLYCNAQRIERGTAEYFRLEVLYLRTNPKAKIYVGFGDFTFYCLGINVAALNGGFGQAYQLTTKDLIKNLET